MAVSAFGWAVLFVEGIDKSARKKQINDSLAVVKLKLEIQLKKLELQKLNTNK